MSNLHQVHIGKTVVYTHIITTTAELDQSLSHLLSVAQQEHIKGVIGLDIEKQFNIFQQEYLHGANLNEKVAALILCSDNACLIIKLSSMYENFRAFRSISKFLQLQELTFVGMRIQYCLQALENDFKINCRNAFELGELSKFNSPNKKSFEAYTLVDFASKVIPTFDLPPITISQARSMCNADALSDWGAATLSQQQIEAATVRAYLCYYTGCYLYFF